MKAFGLVMEYDPRAVVWEGASAGPGHLLTSQGDQAPLFQVLHERPGLLVIGNGITDGRGGYRYILHVHPEEYERALEVLDVDQDLKSVADYHLDIRRRFAARG